MGHYSFRSSSPSSKVNVGRQKLKFFIIVCMTMVFVLWSSTSLTPLSNLMKISASNAGPDSGVVAKETDQLSAYTLQHKEVFHVQDGRIPDVNSQELNQSSDDEKVSEWFGERPSTIPVQMEVSGEESVSTTLAQEELDESDTVENDSMTQEFSSLPADSDNVGTGTGTAEESMTSTLREKVDVSSNADNSKNVEEQVPTESTDIGEMSNQEPISSSAEKETPAIIESVKEEVQNISDTSEELISSYLEEKSDAAPRAKDGENVEERVSTEPTDIGGASNQELISTPPEEETPSVTTSKDEEVQKDSGALRSSDSHQEGSEEPALAASEEESPSVSEFKNEGSDRAEKSTQSADNDKKWEQNTTNQEPIPTTSELKTAVVTEAKNKENSERVNSTQSFEDSTELEEKNKWNQDAVPSSQEEQILATTEPKNDKNSKEQVSTTSTNSFEAWLQEEDISAFNLKGDKPGNLSTDFNVALLRIANDIRSHSLPYSTRKYENQADLSCEGKYVYVYDLPPEFNTDLAAKCDTLFPWFNLCDYFVDSGIGKPVDTRSDGRQIMVPANRWFNTHQYALELVSHVRIKNYKCLTQDPDQASLFYIPYYAGLDVIRWHFAENATNEKRDELTLKLFSWLEQKPSWSRRKGFDHVLFLGKISWDFHRNIPYGYWGSSMLERPETRNVTKVLIERSSWVKKELAVPHPTFFHPTSAADIDTWLNHIRSQERTSLVTFVGKGRPGTTNVREQLIQQCRNASSEKECRIVHCDHDLCQVPAYVNVGFLSTHFCMQPIGDSPTRRSVFDSLIAGCIPVLFHPCTAYTQYLWHLPANTSSWSVYISEDDVKEGRADVVEVLKKFPSYERDAMRETIINTIIPGLLYSAPGSDVSPYRDAFDITMENLLHRVSHLTDGIAAS